MNKEVLETSKILVKEISENGFSCDTLASDRLQNFCIACAGDEEMRSCARRIKDLDELGIGRKRAMTYALIAIGNRVGSAKSFFDANMKKFVHSSTQTEKGDCVKTDMNKPLEEEPSLKIGKYIQKCHPMCAIKYTQYNVTEVLSFVGWDKCSIVNQNLIIRSKTEEVQVVKFGNYIVKIPDDSIFEFSVFDESYFLNNFEPYSK